MLIDPVSQQLRRIEAQFGSVGRFMPGMEWKLEPVDGVSEITPEGRIVSGRLFVRGPNVMRGYLNAEANAAFQALGGWYDTGDLARVDDDGFVFLLGRMKRFAKISGEMVSLTAVEDALAGAFPQHGLRCEIAVVAVADVTISFDALSTMTFSPVSPHLPATGRLLASPSYDAIQW